MKIFSKLWAIGNWKEVLYVIADKGYDFYAVRQCLRQAGKKPIIPRRQGAICPGVQDKERYQTRSNIERFFGKIKENKRLALRYDKLDITFFSFFALACLKVLKLICKQCHIQNALDSSHLPPIIKYMRQLRRTFHIYLPTMQQL